MTSLAPADAETPTATLFQEPWWLDAAAPGEWDEVIVRRGDAVAARMPFVRRRRLGLTVLTMPALTPSLGPWMRPSDAKYCNRLGDEKELLGELIDALPRFDLFQQTFAPEFVNWLPFHWKGFRSSSFVTYRIAAARVEDVWADVMERTRRNVRKAERSITVREDLSIDEFLRLNRAVFQRQGVDVPYSEAVVRRIDSACVARGARTLLAGVDSAGRTHAAVYIVNDSRVSYYLMGGSDPALRDSAATSLLLWTAVKRAMEASRIFDFEGSMREPIERLFRGFGARQTPYLFVTGSSVRGTVARAARDVFAALRGTR